MPAQPSLPPFELLRPATVAEAAGLLEKHGDEAAAMCGGTELLLLLKLGLARPAYVVDLKRLPELTRLEREDDALVVGAATTHRTLERSALVRESFPQLAAMEGTVANVRVRAAGTIGGNVSFADPHSDVLTFLAVTDADVLLEGTRGSRVVPLAGFVRGPYQTELAAGEVVTGFRIPLPPPGTRFAHRKLAFHERPAVTVTCALAVEDGVVRGARLGIGSVGPRVVRSEAAAGLVGMRVDDVDAGHLEAVGEAAARDSGAVADANGSEDYKLALVATLVRRAAADALRG